VDRDPLKDEPPPPSEAFPKVLRGEVLDPIVPPHLEPRESPEEELTRLALEDPQALELPPDSGPTVWRLMALIAFAVIALGVVFWRNP
jgi:hypothetical protein